AQTPPRDGPAAVAAAAAAAPDDASLTRMRIRPRVVSETVLTSRAGRDYRIQLSLPLGPPPEGGFPVIYVLDGDAWFVTAAEIARQREWSRLPPAVVVGVGYPGTVFLDGERRSFDFTPPGVSDPEFEGAALGGADDLLAFLTGELKPWVRHRLRGEPGPQALFGHSLGGVFVLHAALSAPDSFDAFIAASPSMRLFDRQVWTEADAFAARPNRGSPRLLVTVGGLESHPAPAFVDDYRRWYRAHPEALGGQELEAVLAQTFPDDPAYDKTADTRALTERLAALGARASFVEFPGEEHTAAAVNALNRAVPFALRPAG
ncbi:alpha/beta hydrolase-fold protein, partial [Caulobacter sp. 17J65-9]|uniref:alpha/beta hydrolase n=1 Tax=Caulobacter sp. 17J65-9 TaxID=2709382 RepID=UPI0013C5BD13